MQAVATPHGASLPHALTHSRTCAHTHRHAGPISSPTCYPRVPVRVYSYSATSPRCTVQGTLILRVLYSIHMGRPPPRYAKPQPCPPLPTRAQPAVYTRYCTLARVSNTVPQYIILLPRRHRESPVPAEERVKVLSYSSLTETLSPPTQRLKSWLVSYPLRSAPLRFHCPAIPRSA